jgi:hypothetical protein
LFEWIELGGRDSIGEKKRQKNARRKAEGGWVSRRGKDELYALSTDRMIKLTGLCRITMTWLSIH